MKEYFLKSINPHERSWRVVFLLVSCYGVYYLLTDMISGNADFFHGNIHQHERLIAPPFGLVFVPLLWIAIQSILRTIIICIASGVLNISVVLIRAYQLNTVSYKAMSSLGVDLSSTWDSILYRELFPCVMYWLMVIVILIVQLKRASLGNESKRIE